MRNEIKPKNNSVEKAFLTARDMAAYCRLLNITESFFNSENEPYLILDLGSGTEQNLAKEVRLKKINAQIVSLDPKLALDEDQDLKVLFKNEENIRINARKNPEPFTIAGVSTNIPIEDGAFDKIVALYSVPYYLDKNEHEKIESTLKEIIRVLKIGGIAKIFPIEPNKKEFINAILESQKDITFKFEDKNTIHSIAYILTITKN